jgi:NTP pyrophosphatase (non-canonical NTP hydrolase)
MIVEIELFEFPDLIPLDFCLWDCVESEVYKRKMETRDELRACILYSTGHTKKGEDELRRTKRDIRTRVAKRTQD